MVLLESEQFLTELTRLFQKCRLSGSVFITLKKYDGRTKPIPRKGSVEGFEPSDNKCLLRATDGKKKISTVVSSKEVNKFQMAYSNLLRANMDGLKKRDKKSKTPIRKLPMETVKVPEFHIAAYSWLTASLGLSHSQWEQLLLHGFQTDLKQRVSEFMVLSCSMFCNTPDDGGGGDYRIHSGDSMG
uniref:Signal recognition particle 14 kDa protein n=2 Tax=Laurasiatheria TaxID=314145 RepID=A0A671E437_RHIFE